MRKNLSSHQTILRVLLISNYLNVFGFALFGPLFTLFVLDLGTTPLQVSQLYGVYALTYGVSLLVFGKLQNRIRRKQGAVVIGFFLLSIAAFAFLFVTSIPQAFVVQMLNAMAAGWTLPAYKALYGRSEDRGRETEEWSWMDGGNQILVALATILGGIVYTLAGFQVLISVVGATQFFAAIASLKLLDTKLD